MSDDGIVLTDEQREQLVTSLHELDSAQLFGILTTTARIVIRRNDNRSGNARFYRRLLENFVRVVDGHQRKPPAPAQEAP